MVIVLHYFFRLTIICGHVNTGLTQCTVFMCVPAKHLLQSRYDAEAGCNLLMMFVFRSTEAGDQPTRHSDQDRSLRRHLHVFHHRLRTATGLDCRSVYSLARTGTCTGHCDQRKVGRTLSVVDVDEFKCVCTAAIKQK